MQVSKAVRKWRLFNIIFIPLIFIYITRAFASDTEKLPDLISEALKNNPELRMAEAKWKAAEFRISQAGSLPDPMFMIGYQNEGWERYTYGEMQDAMWMFSASQMFPFPGKLSLKKNMAEKDAEGVQASYDAMKQKIIAQLKEKYFDLVYQYKSKDVLEAQKILYAKIEEAAAARYATGMALQQEVLMAQTEKYMLIEKEQMLEQKIEADGAMLNAILGRNIQSPLGRPEEPAKSSLRFSLDEYIKLVIEESPEIKIKRKMTEAAEYRTAMNQKEYYPDITLTGSVFKREKPFDDMWSLTTTFNIPLFFRSKQRKAVAEAKSMLVEARSDFESARLMMSSAVKDNYSMAKTAESLMELYREGLIPKARQGFESALSGYGTGKIELITLIKSLTSLLDYEIQYWNRFAEREKAVARLEALIGEGRSN